MKLFEHAWLSYLYNKEKIEISDILELERMKVFDLFGKKYQF